MKKYNELNSYERFVCDEWNVPFIRSWNDLPDAENKSDYEETDVKLLYLRLGSGFYVADDANALQTKTGIKDTDTWNKHIYPLHKSLTFTIIRKK